MSEKFFKVSCCESSARKESFKNLSKSSSNGTNRQSVKSHSKSSAKLKCRSKDLSNIEVVVKKTVED